MYKYSLRETELITALPYTFHASKRLKYNQSLQSARRFNAASPDSATSASVDVRHRIAVIVACVSMTYPLCLTVLPRCGTLCPNTCICTPEMVYTHVVCGSNRVFRCVTVSEVP